MRAAQRSGWPRWFRSCVQEGLLMPIPEIPVSSPRSEPNPPVTWAAFTVAGVGLAGSLFLSLGMELKACPLCFYQRAFVMSVFAVLGMGLFAGTPYAGRLSFLVLPLAVAGLGVALFHVYLETAGKLECPEGLLGWGTAPKQ